MHLYQKIVLNIVVDVFPVKDRGVLLSLSYSILHSQLSLSMSNLCYFTNFPFRYLQILNTKVNHISFVLEKTNPLNLLILKYFDKTSFSQASAFEIRGK